MGRIVRGTNGTKNPRMVRKIHGTKYPRYEKSTYGTKRLWYEKSGSPGTCRGYAVNWYDHITPVLEELHWHPVWRRVDFKVATLVYLSLSGMAPAYLGIDCQVVSDEGRRQLCLSHQGRVVRPTATIEKDVLQLQVRNCGTAFQLICDRLTATKDIFVRVLRSRRIVTNC